MYIYIGLFKIFKTSLSDFAYALQAAHHSFTLLKEPDLEKWVAAIRILFLRAWPRNRNTLIRYSKLQMYVLLQVGFGCSLLSTAVTVLLN